MLKAIAIDDEPIALEIIKSLSASVSFIHLTDVFTNGMLAIDYIQRNPVDLIFLDIKMPGLSGIDLLKSIPRPPMVIITTAYTDHAVTSFELDAVDYLLKPFSLSRFLKACNKAYELFNLRNNHQSSLSTLPAVFIKSGYEQVKVELSEVLYIESISNYLRFVLVKKAIVSRLTISEAEAMLPPTAFIRIHRSYIVSKNHVTKIDKKSVWLNTIELPIGASYISEVENSIRKLF